MAHLPNHSLFTYCLGWTSPVKFETKLAPTWKKWGNWGTASVLSDLFNKIKDHLFLVFLSG